MRSTIRFVTLLAAVTLVPSARAQFQFRDLVGTYCVEDLNLHHLTATMHLSVRLRSER